MRQHPLSVTLERDSLAHRCASRIPAAIRHRNPGHCLETASLPPPLAALRRFPPEGEAWNGATLMVLCKSGQHLSVAAGPRQLPSRGALGRWAFNSAVEGWGKPSQSGRSPDSSPRVITPSSLFNEYEYAMYSWDDFRLATYNKLQSCVIENYVQGIVESESQSYPRQRWMSSVKEMEKDFAELCEKLK